jgi:hypothetical protein
VAGATEQQRGGVGNNAAQNQQGGGPMGWFRQAGGWMGDKVGQATDAVGQWAGETKQAAQEVWDVATTTSVGMEDGTVYVETDLDELSDLMSPETQAALALDRATADNRVRITYDRASGDMVATCDELALSGVHTAKVQSGAVLLRGVRAVFTNQGGKIPGLGENFSLLGYKDAADNIQAVVTIRDAQATDVSFAGPNGQTEVASVKLTGLTGTVGAEGGMPFAEAGSTEVDFALEHALLEGLTAEGHTVASAELSGVSGGMSGAKESAFLAADAVAVSSVTSGDQQLAGQSSLSGLRVDVDNTGGGLLGADGKADQARARVAVEAAKVSQLDTADFDAAGVSAQKLTGSFDTTTGLASGSAGSLGVDGLDTSWVDATRMQADGLSVDGDLRGIDGRRDLDLDIDKLSGDGLSVMAQEGVSSNPGMGGMPLDWSADIDAADITRAQAGGASIDRAQFEQMGFQGVIDGEASNFSADARHTELSGFAHDEMTADRLATTNTSLTAEANHTDFAADHVEANNLNTDNLRASELHAFGGTASLGDGGATATLEQARMLDATIAGRLDIQETHLDQLTASSSASGQSVSASGGQVIGVSDRQTDARLGSASFQQANLGIDGSGATATVGHTSITDAQGFGASLSSGSVDGLAASRRDGTDTLTATQASVNSMAYGDTSVQSGSLTGISASRTGDVGQVGIESASAAGLSHGDTSVAHLHAGGITGRRDADGMIGSAERASARQIQLGDTASVATAGFTDIAATHDANGSQATLGTAALGGVGFQTTSAQGHIHSVDVQGAHAGRDASGQQYAGAGGVQMRDLQASGRTSSSTPGASSGGLDVARLVETSSAQLRHADLSGRASMNSGKIDEYGLKVEEDTQVAMGVSIRNGAVQDQGSHAEFSQPIDGPLWTSVRGAYIKDGRLRGDVNGWWDKDLTGSFNESLGLSGDRLPSAAAIGAALADKMRQPGSASSSDLSGIVDTNSVQIDGSAQLGSGVIDAGVGQVDLAEAQQLIDNRVDFKSRDGSLEAAIESFLADSASFSSDGVSASTGPVSVSGASMDANADSWNIQADALDASDLRSSQQ